MLYTTYLAKAKHLPEEMFKILITRFPPKWLNIDYQDKDRGVVLDYKNMILNKKLSPSANTLLNYKDDNDWDKYCLEFDKEMKTNDFIEEFDKLINYLKLGKDIAIICVEKDYLHCHRYIEAKEIAKHEIKWKEL